MEGLFDLVRLMDRNEDEILFFADEGGSWLLGIDWHRVLRFYFRALARCTDADDYEGKVARVFDLAPFDRAHLLALARDAATLE